MTEFGAEARQRAGSEVPLAAGTTRRRRREGVDDEPTAVAGVVIALVGVRFRLDRAVDADGVRDPLVFAPGRQIPGVVDQSP